MACEVLATRSLLLVASVGLAILTLSLAYRPLLAIETVADAFQRIASEYERQ